jgi:hypothetical protein
MISSLRRQNLAWLILAVASVVHGRPGMAAHPTNHFRLYTRPFTMQEGGTVTCHVLETASARFSFRVPLNWAVKENPAKQEVVMMARNLITSIRFKIVEAELGSTKEARIAQWRQSVEERHREARITAQFPCYTSRIEGTALDIERTAPNKAKVFSRLAFIPLPDGRVEFDLTTTSSDPMETRLAFGNFLTSFRVEPLSAQ